MPPINDPSETLLKICFCVPNFKSDLIEATSSTTTKLANQLVEKCDCTLLIPGDLPAQADQNGKLKWISFAPTDEYISKVRVFKNIKALGHYFRQSKEHYDLVHFQLGNLLEMFLIWLFLPKIDAVRICTIWQPYIGVLESLKMPWVFRRSITSVIHHYFFNTWLHLPFFILGQNYFSKIIVQTKRQRNQLLFIGKKRIQIIINGVEGRTSERESTPRKDGPVRILYIGHATAVKGLDTLLESLAKIRTQIDFRATLALSSYKSIDPEALVQKHGLEDYVDFMGEINVYEEMRNHDMLLCPYKISVGTAWQPNIVLEAFSVGLPVIATAVPELCEIAEDGITGKLVPPNNPGALANAILAISGHPKLAAEIRNNQRRLFKKNFTFELYSKSHWDLYKTLLGFISPDGAVHREQSVKDFYSKKAHARNYDKIRFSNAGGQLIDNWEKTILLEMIDGHSKEQPIVDVAAGTGRFSIMLARMGYRVLSIDHSMEMLLQIQAVAQEENLDITCIRSDAFIMPFADDTFSTVFSLRFVWHYKAMHNAISELARIARGNIIVDLINRHSLASLTMSVANHIVRRELYTELTTRGKIENFFRRAELVPIKSRSAFFFPYIFYRKLSALTPLMGFLDRFIVRTSPFGTLLYYKLSKKH